MTDILIRRATLDDADSIAKVYGWHVTNGTGTFEEIPPTAHEMGVRVGRLRDQGFPIFVASLADEVVGFAYAGPHKERAAYRFTVEDTIYVKQDQHRKGIGWALLAAIVTACQGAGYRQMMAVIGDAENANSIALHTRAGFRLIGTAQRIGYKYGRELDVVYMQKDL